MYPDEPERKQASLIFLSLLALIAGAILIGALAWWLWEVALPSVILPYRDPEPPPTTT